MSNRKSEGPGKKGHGTRSSAFGSPGRINHDSRPFYSSRLYEGRSPEQVEFVENPAPDDVLDRIFQKTSEHMAELPDQSVHLMVTSPPYNVSKEYDEDLSLDEYRRLLRRVLEETYRVLVMGGRACVNIANLGRKPYLPMNGLVSEEMNALGYLMRGEIIWNKAGSASPSTAWGSWLSATNPVLRDVHEYILVFSKGSFSRPSAGKVSTIERDEFLEWTRSIWTFPAVSARQIGHPAPFPEELPLRLINLYSFQGDIVLDPFCGSGTTCLAAARAGRRYVGYEINSEYVRLAEARLSEARAEEPAGSSRKRERRSQAAS